MNVVAEIKLSERDKGAADALRIAAVARTKIRESYARRIANISQSGEIDLLATPEFSVVDTQHIRFIKFLNDLASEIERGAKTLDSLIEFTSQFEG